MPMTGRRLEAAFTVVEIIVAILLITVVIGGVTMALASGSRLESKRDLSSRMVAASERVYEHLRSNKSWTEGCRRARPTAPPKSCTVTSSIDTALLKDDVFGPSFAFRASASAVGVDNDGDGLGAQDQDGTVDDFFRITITIEVPRADAARLGATKPRVVQSLINGSAGSDSGTLIVAICSADNQIDERIQISGCQTGSTYWTEMPTCAEDPGCAPWSNGSLIGKMSFGIPSRLVGITPISGVSFSLTRVPDGTNPSGPTRISSSMAIAAAPGEYRFPDIPSGTWAVNTPTSYPGGRIDWPTHHIPSTKRATVEAKKTARALVMLQRPARSQPFRMTFSRYIYERQLTGRVSGKIPGPRTPECEAPASFTRGAYILMEVECDEASGHMTVTETPGGQAILQGVGDFGSIYQSWGAYQNYVTVWYVSQSRSQDEWAGASDSATFVSAPTPSGRFTVRTPRANGADYQIPAVRITVPEAPNRPAAGYRTTGAKAQIAGLPAGLNEPITMESKSTIKNRGEAYQPAGCERNYVWVKSGSGSLGTCRSVHMTGDDGECYTHLSGGSIGVGSYKWNSGCGTVQWPPVGGTIPQPKNYLITRICAGRTSWVSNATKQDFNEYKFEPTQVPGGEPLPEYGTPEWDTAVAAQRAKYEQHYTSNGFTKVNATAVVGRSTMKAPHWYKFTSLGTTQRDFPQPCRDLSKAPLDCPTLTRWDNCTTLYRLTIPATPGWKTGGPAADGNRFRQSGASLSGMSS